MKKLEITEGLRTAVIESLNRLDKYFQEDVQVDVTMRVEKSRQIIRGMVQRHGVTGYEKS